MIFGPQIKSFPTVVALGLEICCGISPLSLRPSGDEKYRNFIFYGLSENSQGAWNGFSAAEDDARIRIRGNITKIVVKLDGPIGESGFVDVKDNCQSLTRFCRCEALLQELNSDIGLMFQLRPIAARLHARIILLLALV